MLLLWAEGTGHEHMPMVHRHEPTGLHATPWPRRGSVLQCPDGRLQQMNLVMERTTTTIAGAGGAGGMSKAS